MSKSLWETMSVGLDGDERLITPEMYLDNSALYDKIIGIGYLIRDLARPNSGLSWTWAGSLERISKNSDVVILKKLLVVRLRLPWNAVEFEWTVDGIELDKHRDDYTVLDTFVWVRHKETGKEHLVSDRVEFETNRAAYDVVKIRYLVEWTISERAQKELLSG